jgi:RNA polymerase sigma-70 factor, ECF subfamily
MPGTRLDSWVFRIIRNLWIDAIRKRKTEGVVEAIDEAANIGGEDGREVTETALTLTDVNDAVSKLPEEQRAVMRLVCTEERSYQEAADLGVPIGTVMSRLARGRRSLAERFNFDDTVRSRETAQVTP